MVNEVELAELAITWPAPSKIRWPTNGNGWNASVAPGALPVVVPLVPVLVPVVPVVPDVPLLGLGMLWTLQPWPKRAKQQTHRSTVLTAMLQFCSFTFSHCCSYETLLLMDELRKR